MLSERVSDAGHDARETDRQIATAVDLVCAYVGHNSVRAADLGRLIETVFGTFRQLSTPPAVKDETPPAPAVPVKKSITAEFLICLEDGRKFRSLKRHLGTVYGLTPDQYRAKWGLSRDYPMVAPAYSAVRSKLAKDIGLGRPARATAKAASASAAVSEPASPKARGRAKTSA